MLVHPQFDPIAVQVGPLAVHWYGLMYLIGFTLFYLLGLYRCRQEWRGITKANLEDLLFVGMVGVIVGGAFTAIVTALTSSVFQPLVNWALAGAGGGLESAVTMLKPVLDEAGAIDMSKSIYIDWGAVVTAVLNFLIIALILFSIVKAIMEMHHKACGVKNHENGVEFWFTLDTAGEK